MERETQGRLTGRLPERTSDDLVAFSEAPTTVLVVDQEQRLVERVSPAVARHALRHGYAQVTAHEPFTIRLIEPFTACPLPTRTSARSRPEPEIIRWQESKDSMSRFSPAQQQVDLASFWERTDRRNGGDGLVWAKSMAPAGQQVIVHIENANKQRFKVPPIKAGNPVCLTSFAPFDVLRDSADLNQCATGGGSATGQPLVRLMTTKEADEFFDKKAKTLKRTKDDLKKEAARVQMQEAQARKLAPSEADTSLKIQDAVVSIQDVINPYIEDLCAQIRPDLDANLRMSASDFMSAMLDLEDSLSFDEVEYVYTHSGIYPSVRSWAAKKKDEIWAASADSSQAYDDLADSDLIENEDEGEGELEVEEERPVSRKAKKR